MLVQPFLLGLSVLALLGAAQPPKPKIRAITGFITIDAKSYAAQIEEAVTFLSRSQERRRGGGLSSVGHPHFHPAVSAVHARDESGGGAEPFCGALTNWRRS